MSETTPELEVSAYELRADHAENFSGGSVNVGNGETLNLGEALDEGIVEFTVGDATVEVASPAGEIVVEAGSAAEEALRAHPAFKSTKAPDVEPPPPSFDSDRYTSAAASEKAAAAAEAGVDVDAIVGTGADGKVKVDDVEKAIAEHENATEGEGSE